MSGLRESLQAIHDQRGALTPRLVVDTWRDPDHPDHGRLEWDDGIAGEKYRHIQARDLIRSLDIVYRKAKGKKPEGRTRAWQSVRSEAGYVYQPAEEVATDPFIRQLVLMDMEREWKQLRARYSAFAEFSAMVLRDLEEGAA